MIVWFPEPLPGINNVEVYRQDGSSVTPLVADIFDNRIDIKTPLPDDGKIIVDFKYGKYIGVLAVSESR